MNIFVACSAFDEIPKEVLETSRNLLETLSKTNEYNLVNGGNTAGLMKLSHDTFRKYGNYTTAAIASIYQDDIDGMDCDLKIVTDNTFERSKEIMLQSDILLFLPGGLGTMAEFFGMLEEKRTYKIAKPMILYNESHAFDLMLNVLEDMRIKGYAKEEDLNCFKVVSNQEELFEILENKKPKSKVK